MPDEFSSPSVPSEIEEPPLSTELNEDEATPETPADLVTAAPRYSPTRSATTCARSGDASRAARAARFRSSLA